MLHSRFLGGRDPLILRKPASTLIPETFGVVTASGTTPEDVENLAKLLLISAIVKVAL